MTELVFPLAATLILLLVAIPLATIVCKIVLVVSRPPQTESGVREWGSSARYLLLIAPVAVPVVWLLSAALHHGEAEEAALTCLFDHLSETWCAEPLAITGAVLGLLAGTFLWRRRIATRAVAARAATNDELAERNIAAAVRTNSRLASLAPCVRLVEGDEIRTLGLLRRSVEVGAELARSLSADELASALLHEAEHVRGFDPLRFVVAAVCQTLNPASALLAGEIARWRAGREAVCDEAAVHHGANPYSLAEALIAAARPREPVRLTSAYLGRGGGIELLRIRVALLMSYATRPARCHCTRTATKLAVLAIVALATLPHYWGDHLMIDLHLGAERTAIDALSDAKL